MHAERDHLVKVVFPALREQLQPYRVELIDIDLRWGVTREQAENDQVISLCLEEIDQSRPFFLGILGQRYGWVPSRLPEDAVRRFAWLTRHPGVSVTELEVLHGALLEGRHARTLFCCRDPKALDSVPALTRATVFTEPTPLLAGRLADLKRRIEASGSPAAAYSCTWDEEAYDRPTRSLGRLTGLEEFGRLVQEWLWNAIRAHLQLPDEPSGLTVDPLDEEADFHERFLESRRRWYVGRQTLQQDLLAYAGGQEEVLGLVTGPSGCGKSAALAQFVHTLRRQDPDAVVLAHFPGASPYSTSLRDLDGAMSLRRQEEEICRRLDDPAGLQCSMANQALILKARGNLDGAMSLLKQQEEICRRLNDPAALQRSLGNQAVILAGRGDLDGAMSLHKQEEEICRRLNDPAGLETCLGNQALILADRGDLDGAMSLLKQQEEICRRLDDPNRLAASLTTQASLLARKSNQPHLALPLVEEADRLASTHGLTGLAQEIAACRQEINHSLRNADVCYRFKVVCPEKEQAVVRAILLRHVNSQSGMNVQGISIQDQEHPDRTTVVTEIFSARRDDRFIDELMSRLSIEPWVSSVSWERLS
jgi:hypothetical protein